MKYSRGNILFLILIGVALFGALAYAVTQGSRGGGKGDISDEQADIAASQVIQMADQIATAVSRLQIVRGCEDDEFDFANDVYVKRSDGTPILASGHNSNAPISEKCSIFAANGGGVTAKQLPDMAKSFGQTAGDWESGSGGPVSAVVEGVGTSARDLVWAFPHIDREVCLKINQKLSVPNPSDDLPQDSPDPWSTYNGTFTGSSVIADDEPLLNGVMEFCLDSTSTTPPNDVYFFKVLIAR